MTCSPQEMQAAYADHFPWLSVQRAWTTSRSTRAVELRPAPVWPRPGRPSATNSSTTWACRSPVRPLLPARAQDPHRAAPVLSSCAWPWLRRLNEPDRNARAIEFYELLSSFDFMSSTRRCSTAARCALQLSSCYLTTAPDDLDGIYESIKENAPVGPSLPGGLGNDWDPACPGFAHQGHQRRIAGAVPLPRGESTTRPWP